MQNIQVLVFPGGSEVGLEINKSLKNIYFITLYGASSVHDHGEWEYDNYISDIPFVTDDLFVEKLNAVIDKYKIDFIFPALDSVALKLSEIRENLHAKVLTSSKEAVEICRDKIKTYKKLEGCFFLPKIYNKFEDVKNFPVLIKPAVGQGAHGVKVIFDKESLKYELQHASEQIVICEYLPGKEYTVDCFTDKEGRLRYCAHRSRNRIRNGISVNSVLEPYDKKINEIAEMINKKMSFCGAWFFQVKVANDGEYRLMEVATRIAGTMCVDRARGINLPLLTVFDALGYDVDIEPQFNFVETDRALENCYKIDLDFDELYIDYDDTIVIRDKINLQAVSLLYKCVNKHIPIYLVTKHDTDILSELKNRKISENLFIRIVHITKNCNKADYISPSKKALYVDDSFAERKKIHDRYGIKTIGVDMIEVLLNGCKM